MTSLAVRKLVKIEKIFKTKILIPIKAEVNSSEYFAKAITDFSLSPSEFIIQNCPLFFQRIFKGRRQSSEWINSFD